VSTIPKYIDKDIPQTYLFMLDIKALPPALAGVETKSEVRDVF
jgi:hypothetical protein